MNTRLTYKPSLLDRFVLGLAWLEAQLRCDLMPLFSRHEMIEDFTITFQNKTMQLLQTVKAVWQDHRVFGKAQNIYGEYPDVEITATNILMPSLFYLHVRLCLELAYYQRQDKKNELDQRHHIQKHSMKIRKLMPSWERFRIFLARRNKITTDIHVRMADDYVENSLDSFARMTLGCIFITIIGGITFYLLSNVNLFAEFLANLIVKSGLPFVQAYNIVIASTVTWFLFIVLIALEFFHQPSAQSIFDRLDQRTDEIQVQIASTNNTLDNELLPRIGNFDVRLPSDINKE
jgi:hypothetical protein